MNFHDVLEYYNLIEGTFFISTVSARPRNAQSVPDDPLPVVGVAQNVMNQETQATGSNSDQYIF